MAKVVKNMSEALTTGAAEESLLQLSSHSEENAIRLAKELAESLLNKSVKVDRQKAESKQQQQNYYPIEVPESLSKSTKNMRKYQKI